ncbi:RCC1-like G exchanging factor-like protein [Pomacea canaliculata]|nr:RCC1-like G exchanging factor-like protein [Pomacea canaliculata]XP_025091348.1 RCC1-like G exchanging factor-like protein [Pomacea canaliculata]XP_025091349.1 RCC1-like G exchanging factor-like protein [Pomacea canaliculata]
MASNLGHRLHSLCWQVHQPSSPLVFISRSMKNWKKKILMREDLKEKVIEYAGKHQHQEERIYSWGCAATGALGIASYLKPGKGQNPIYQQPRPALVKFFYKSDIKPYLVSCGYGFTLYAVKSAKGLQLLGTGINTNSQLGSHEVPRNSGRYLDYIIQPLSVDLPLNKPLSTRARHIGCGRAHTVIIMEDAGVFSLGNNSYGQCCRPVVDGEDYRRNPLVNHIENIPEEVAQVWCGQDHTIFISKSGKLYSCGLGADGQTGLGHYNSVSTPTLVKGDIEGEKIVSVHGKGDCVLAVSDKGQLFGWGNSEYNQLAMVTNENQINIPRHLPVNGCGHIIKAVAGGSICAVLNDKGQVFVWGYGILGKGPALSSSSTPTQIPETLFGRSEIHPNIKVTEIDCGLDHFVACTDQGYLYSWGHSRQGCLGLGADNDQYFPFQVSLPAEVRMVACGVDHTVALCKPFC